uniref:Coiled-coil-helix-coiled-coil-helix domain containing 1 n=1 Tax=Fundulus heteroclitus TaxID=8078 RepID=A0A3Q2T7B5_FUNHE
MAAQGGAPFLEKVNKLLCRQNGKPVLKPNRPLVLKECVANRKPKKGEATCITEMSVLMACWKQNNFVDGLCSNEIHSFYTCVQNAQVGPAFPPETLSLSRSVPHAVWFQPKHCRSLGLLAHRHHLSSA